MLVIGSIFVDVKGFAFEHYMPEGRNLGDVQVVAGGVCRNVAENLSRLGRSVRFVSMVDDDAVGRQVKDELTAMGIDTSHVVTAPRGMGMWLAILDEHGALAGSISRQPDFSALERYLKDNGDAVMQGARAVALEIDTSAEISGLVLELARRHQVPVYAIVGNMGVILQHPEYLHDVSCFICNEMEAARLFRAELAHVSPEEMLKALKSGSALAGIPAMVITMGPQGAVYMDNISGEFGYCPPLPTKVVDTTGAGDAFFSAAVSALVDGEPLSSAVQAGTQLAARTLGVQGSCTDGTVVQ